PEAEHVLAERVRARHRMALSVPEDLGRGGGQEVRVPGDRRDHHPLVLAVELEHVRPKPLRRPEHGGGGQPHPRSRKDRAEEKEDGREVEERRDRVAPSLTSRSARAGGQSFSTTRSWEIPTTGAA